MKPVFVVALASAVLVAHGTPIKSSTWCGTNSGMITAKAGCQAAATAHGYGTVLDAGSEWHAGCIIQSGKVYYSPYFPHTGLHNQAVNDGYFCDTEPDVSQNDYVRTGTWCGPSDGMITSKVACQNAGLEYGFNEVADAGPEWHAGCIRHHGKLYYSPLTPGASHDSAVSDGYLCSRETATTSTTTTLAPTTTTTTTTPIPCDLTTHYRPSGPQTCAEKVCICPGSFGNAATGAACAQHGGIKCTSCHAAWRHLNPLTHECDLNACHCSNGQVATDQECTQDGGHICVQGTCHAGYHMVGTECQPFAGDCENGQLIAQEKRVQHHHCGQCDTGYLLVARKCEPHGCVKGTGSGCKSCATQSARTSGAHCATCNPGHHLVGSQCVACASGYYSTDGLTCTSCAQIDALRYYWTEGKVGQTYCKPKPLSCKGDDTWSSWSTCTATCGPTGTRVRTRGYKQQQPCSLSQDDLPAALQGKGINLCAREWPLKDVAPNSGAHGCETVSVRQEEPCNTDLSCPVDCQVGLWGAWSDCTEGGTSVTCHKEGTAVGRHTRTRTHIQPKFNGQACPHDRETATCATSCCKGYQQDEAGESAAADTIRTQTAVRIAHDVVVESVRDIAGHYRIAFADAPAVCAARGSGWSLCTHTQLQKAFHAGMSICSCGWASNGQMYYPMQEQGGACGVNIGLHSCGTQTYVGAFGDAFCCGQRQAPKCTQCGKGTFSDWVGVGKCQKCPAGKYQDTLGASSCQSCPKGRASSVEGAESKADCAICGAGTYSDKEGLKSCKTCSKGTEQPLTTGATKASQCKACAAGHYAATEGAVACEKCTSGQYQEGTGAHSCVECEAGTHLDSHGSTAGSECADCQPGKYSQKGKATCTKCAAGKSSAAIAAKAEPLDPCTNCGLGHFAVAGSARCEACDFGTYADAEGSTACKVCAAGTYNNHTARAEAQACIPCPKGHWCGERSKTPQPCLAGTSRGTERAQQLGDCEVCQKGYHSSTDKAHSCVACAGGRYQDQAGQSSCKKCTAGTENALPAQTTSNACRACAAGKYQPVADRTFCVPCGKGFYVAGSGAVVCNKCPKGMFGEVRGATTIASGCSFCSNGQYADDEASTTCKDCTPGKYSATEGAVSYDSCLNCAWGQFTELPGQESCVKCKAGKYGHSGGVQGHPSHCVHCPEGQFQEVDGSTLCKLCKPDTYIAQAGENVQCEPCSVQNVDTLRVYWTNGQSGQKECTQKPLNCEMSDWSSWSTCTLSCRSGTTAVGRQSRSRTAKLHGMPNSASCKVADCAEGWGAGALPCSAEVNRPNEARNCNEHQCPVNCVVTDWSSWSQCTKSCGKGETTRQRAVRTPASHGGTCSEHRSETTDCNDVSCAVRDLPRCHNQHIHCAVVAKERLGAGWGPNVGPQCHLWNSHAHTGGADCHDCDTGLECNMKGVHHTLVVTHDRKFAALAGQTNMFHCFYSHPAHPERAAFPAVAKNQCYCTCSMHPPCEGVLGKALSNTAIVGNRWHGVLKRQDCCNMCTNHPQCGSFTYRDNAQLCELFKGAPTFIDAVDASSTWSGCESGSKCSSAIVAPAATAAAAATVV